MTLSAAVIRQFCFRTDDTPSQFIHIMFLSKLNFLNLFLLSLHIVVAPFQTSLISKIALGLVKSSIIIC